MSAGALDPALSGLDQLKLAFGEGPGGSRYSDGIGPTLGFRALVLEEGRVVFGGTPTRQVLNPIGTVHGGYAATLLDSACACAVHSVLPAGKGYTTLELKVAFLRAMTPETGEVQAEGKVVQAGRRAAFAEATLKDAAGRVYATATSTLLIVDL